MKAVGIIPARYHSTRFEGKALALLCGRPVILHVCEQAGRAQLLSSLIVATDDERIAAAVRDAGFQAVMTSSIHPSGTDRVAEAAAGLDADVIVNIQGDEPFIAPETITEALQPFAENPDLQMTTLRRQLHGEDALRDPDVVKVVVDRQGYALYFSRSLIPYPRNAGGAVFEHIGLYAYRKNFLLGLARLGPTDLERTESLEQLRVLEHGHRILAVATAHQVGLSIDTPADLKRAEKFIEKQR